MRRCRAPAIGVVLCMFMVGCAGGGAGVTWRVAEAGFGCDAAVMPDQPRDGKGSLMLATRAKDPAAWLTFVSVRVARAEGKPLGTLGDLVHGGTLTLDLFRDTRTDGVPPYTLPWVALRVRNADGEEALLLWESPYNGYPPGKGVVPAGAWLDDVAVHSGIFWIRYQGRNYNGGAGFQTLAQYAQGHVTTTQGKTSLRLSDESRIVAIEIGSGPNIPGNLLMYVDDVRLSLPHGGTYHMNFEPDAAMK